jgi:hypothetical protein
VDQRIVEEVRHRAMWRCEFCGRGEDHTMVLHHRRLRSQGGRDAVDNLVWIHDACHRWTHDHPARAYDLGWIVRSWADPAEVPVRVLRIAT